MLQKFVYWTGAMDFLVGAATIGGVIYAPQPGQFVALMTLGMFLMMAAACLMWASKDMVNRYPVMFWQGLVRLTAVSAVIYAVPNGLSEQWEYALVAFDGTIGLTYIIGSIKVTKQSFFDCLLCKTATA
jgi:phosphatidylglycerophosphate synthase